MQKSVQRTEHVIRSRISKVKEAFVYIFRLHHFSDFLLCVAQICQCYPLNLAGML